MSISEAQRDVRQLHGGGFYGQLVSAVVWLCAAAIAQWVSTSGAVLVLIVGGALIFPLTLAMQIAFTVPIGLIVVVASRARRLLRVVDAGPYRARRMDHRCGAGDLRIPTACGG